MKIELEVHIWGWKIGEYLLIIKSFNWTFLGGTEEDPARVIALASDAHNNASGDGRFWQTYSSSEEMASVLGTGIKKIGIKAYCESKLANILHMREMAKRYPEIKFMSVHPGVVNTSFFSFKKGDDFKGTFLGWFMNTRFIRWFCSKIAKTSDQGKILEWNKNSIILI